MAMEVWQKYCSKWTRNAAFQKGSFCHAIRQSQKSPWKISEGSISTPPEDWRYVTYSYASEFKEDAQERRNSCKDQAVLKH